MSVAAKVAFNGKSSAWYMDKNRLKVKGNILVFMSNENDTQKSKVIYTPSLLIVRAQNYWCICVK